MAPHPSLAAYYPQVGRVLRVRNVNEALPQALRLLTDQGVRRARVAWTPSACPARS
jgi:hypothetical protein